MTLHDLAFSDLNEWFYLQQTHVAVLKMPRRSYTQDGIVEANARCHGERPFAEPIRPEARQAPNDSFRPVKRPAVKIRGHSAGPAVIQVAGDQVSHMDTEARSLGLCSFPQPSSRYSCCPPTTARPGKAHRCTLDFQIRETPSSYQNKDRKMPEGIKI